MFVTQAPPHPSAARFARIIEDVCHAVAACGGRGRLAGPLVILLWTRLRRLATRFAALAARAAEPGRGRSQAAARRPRPKPDALPDTPQDTPHRAARRPGLPLRFGWLLRLAPEASASGSQLRALLTEPEMAALLAAMPRLARMLRPLCRMLGVVPPGPPAAPARPRAPRARKWRPRRRSDLLLQLRMGTPLIRA